MAPRTTASEPAQPTPSVAEQADLSTLQRSGLFDGAWFVERNPDFAGRGHEALVHWHRYGWMEGRWPNPYFDPAYYTRTNPDARGDPLLHYVVTGDAAGRRPVPYFDPAWYRQHHDVMAGENCLAHYLRRRTTGLASPIPEFDTGWYLDQNPDVAASGMDPVEHYLVQGFSEGRQPSATFDPPPARRPDAEPVPLLRLLRQQHEIADIRSTPNIAEEVRRFTRPNAAFETVAPLPPGLPRAAMVLAYYLPQYHRVPENDVWWGAGFTEWTNVQRGLPRFAGHYQPRITRDLGHYSLNGTDTLQRQINLAKGAGLHGFVFYSYWFNGRRVMDAPLEALLADATLSLPFCLMWANENWTRRWDGSDQQVLLSQDYRDADEAPLLAWFARCFADSRYIRLQGRPVLMVYRARLIPDTAMTVARWRHRFQGLHGEDPVFIMAQSFGDTDPRPFGMDAAVEFPPHKLTERLRPINGTLDVLDPRFSAEVYDYGALAAASTSEPAPEYPLIKTAVPGWDNDARRQGQGTVLHGATPDRYQSWLEDLVRDARRRPVFGESIVCINAWNEWAEGAYLEPDVHWGAAFLNATSRAIGGLPKPAERTRILLVGHDARDHGAQRLLLHIGRTLKAGHGIDIAFLLLAGGVLEAEYRALATVAIAADRAGLEELVQGARGAGCTGAVVNSAASARACVVLARHGIASTLLVHELPQLIREKGLVGDLREGIAAAQCSVFPATFVRDRCRELLGLEIASATVLSQGLYAPTAPDTDAYAAVRSQLRIPATALVAIGIGYADLRKGFDLFLQVWRAAQSLGRSVHMVWAGGMDPAIERHFAIEMAAAEGSGTFRYLGPRDDVPALLAAADVFLLTSREDPLPSAALEALAAGTPVVAFAETGGIPEVLAACDGGVAVQLGDVAGMAAAAMRLAVGSAAGRARLAAATREGFRFERYAQGVLSLTKPTLLRISAVVLSHNYERFMAERLASVLAQSHPVHEVILLDDASSDRSVAVAERIAAEWGRDVSVERRIGNSGSVFGQWRRAAERATGDWLWIAEADDSCDPLFLSHLAAAIGRASDPVMAFCDSRAIDSDGGELWPDHKAYYEADGPGTLTVDGVHDGHDFLVRHLSERNLILNASAVLWRRSTLLDALVSCEAELSRLSMAGDWRLYAEVLSRPGAQISYVARPLNHHRRHAGSVSSQLDRPTHVAEIEQVHESIVRLLGGGAAMRSRQRRYRKQIQVG